MTTDNKTLADVQPGGRVRLGDAELRKAIADVVAESRTVAHVAAMGNQTDDAQRCLDAAQQRLESALSAQPSPGGQDALAEAARRVISDVDSGDYGGTISMATYDALVAALSARQPVGQEPVDVEAALADGDPDWQKHCRPNLCGSERLLFAVRDIAEMRAFLAGEKKPLPGSGLAVVRVNPAAPGLVPYQVAHRLLGDAYQAGTQGVGFGDQAEELFDAMTAQNKRDRMSVVYAAPPAQAVDLGRWSQRHADDLHVAVHTALSVHAGSLSQKKRAAISAYVKRLLIDSQAAGK